MVPHLLFLFFAVSYGWFAPKGIVEPGPWQKLRSYKDSALYTSAAQGYDDPVYLLDLHGSNRYEMGYHYGALLAKESYSNYWALVTSLLGSHNLTIEIVEAFLDDQYLRYFSKQLPVEFKDEFRGIGDAGIDLGYPDLGRYTERAFTISSIATGDVAKDIEWLLINEGMDGFLDLPQTMNVLNKYGLNNVMDQLVLNVGRMRGQQCSMWGAWDNRTVNNKLWTGRNLDWLAQTGVCTYKLLTVFHPPGQIAYVTVGFAGLTGAITGMSAAGITVHESGDDNTMETGNGFGWALRLRYIMENAKDHATVRQLWDSTNNTLGINHGFGSAADNKFMALETKAGYTAYFFDNDPREAEYEVNGTYYGEPLVNALWRTNHAYDPTFLTTAMYDHPGTDTENRYKLLHDAFVDYESQNILIDYAQAVNITALVGDKGGSSRDSFTSCDAAQDGTNIVSAVYLPSQLVLYAAWENGMKDTHVPACCNYYLKFDMSTWF